MKKMIVYRHRRNDTGEVFYIGIGTKKTRAKSVRSRNTHWHNVVAKAGYTVEIVGDKYTKAEAERLEIALIKMYGRKVDGGCLVNISTGGESGASGIIPWNKGNGHLYSPKFREDARNRMLGKTPWNKGNKAPKKSKPPRGAASRKAILQVDLSGNVIGEFISATEAGKELKLLTSNICRAARLSRTAGGYKWKYKKD